MRAAIAVALVFAAAFPATAQVVPSESVYTSVSLVDAKLVDQPGPFVKVQLVLREDGVVRATESRLLPVQANEADLTGITAAYQGTTDFTNHTYTVEVFANSTLVLGLSGQPVANGSQLAKFRVASLAHPPQSPFVPKGPRLFDLRSGYTSDNVLVGFTPTGAVPKTGLFIAVETSAPGSNVSAARLASDTKPATLTANGNLVARFHLDQLPPVTQLHYSLMHEGMTIAKAAMTLDLPTGKTRDSTYDPGQPPMVAAYGAVHNPRDHAMVVILPDTLLTNSYPAHSILDRLQDYNKVEGARGGQLALDLFAGNASEVAAERPGNATARSEGFARIGLESLGPTAVKVAAIVAAALLLVVLLVQWRRKH